MERQLDCKYILRRRTLSGTGAASILQLFLFSSYVAWIYADFWHPTSWLYYFITTLLSIKTLFVVSPIVAAMTSVGFSNYYTLLAGTYIPKSRIDKLKYICSLPMIMRFVACILLSATISFTYMYITNQAFGVPCSRKPQVRCLNVNNVYVATCAIWVGFTVTARLLFSSGRELIYPVIEQTPFLKIRDEFTNILKGCLSKTLAPVIYYIPMYILFGSLTSNFFKFLTETFYEESNLFCPTVFFRSWLLSTIVSVSLEVLFASVHVYYTQRLNLSIPQLLPILEKGENSYMLELALQDLATHSRNRSYHVGEAFALSHPGGIPHNWKVIFSRCSQLIDQLKLDLDIAASVKSHVKPIDEVKELKKQPVNVRHLIADQPVAPITSPFAYRGALLIGSPASPQSTIPSSGTDKRIIDLAQEFLKKLQPVRFLLDPVPDLYITAVLEHSQPAIWAITILVRLAARALIEDNYGVVVNDISGIVHNLMSLQKALQQVKRKLKSNDRAGKMKAALRDAINRGFMVLGQTYSEHLEHLSLSPEGLRTLQYYSGAGEINGA